MTQHLLSDQEKRNIAMARTLLFNYGQGLWTPHYIYQDACKLVGVSPQFSCIPEVKEIPFAWSFFSKKFILRILNTEQEQCNHMLLYGPANKVEFLAQPSAVKLNWFRNFFWVQELLFNFSAEAIEEVFEILRTKPRELEKRLPFQIGG